MSGCSGGAGWSQGSDGLNCLHFRPGARRYGRCPGNYCRRDPGRAEGHQEGPEGPEGQADQQTGEADHDVGVSTVHSRTAGESGDHPGERRGRQKHGEDKARIHGERAERDQEIAGPVPRPTRPVPATTAIPVNSTAASPTCVRTRPAESGCRVRTRSSPPAMVSASAAVTSTRPVVTLGAADSAQLRATPARRPPSTRADGARAASVSVGDCTPPANGTVAAVTAAASMSTRGSGRRGRIVASTHAAETATQTPAARYIAAARPVRSIRSRHTSTASQQTPPATTGHGTPCRRCQ